MRNISWNIERYLDNPIGVKHDIFVANVSRVISQECSYIRRFLRWQIEDNVTEILKISDDVKL